MRMDPVVQLELEWMSLAAALRSELGRWRASEPALAGYLSALGLIRALQGRGSYASKDELLGALLRLARSERMAGRVVLQALLPGLKQLARRVLFEAGEREEVWELLLAHAWEQICCYPLERRPRRIAANILLDTLRPTLRDLKRERRQRSESRAELAVSASASHDADVERLLGGAVAAGAISPLEAEAILAVRIDGDALAAVAARLGLSYNVLRVRLQRAERRLLLHLGYQPVPRRAEKRPSCPARAIDLGADRAPEVIEQTS
jgi:DNA-directed RNA polymerase specialized sigma24 family protein